MPAALLRLRELHYPGTSSLSGWPTLGLNTLRWAKLQDAVCGTAHSAHGLWVETQALPHYEIPPFDGIGANEYIVDVTHRVPGPNGTEVPAIDFVSTCDTPAVWELNIWYHTLNCGYRPRIAGETDFPCFSDARVGAGRSYVKVEGTLGFDEWAEGIRLGRCYVSDGRSHLIDFTVEGVVVGTANSEVRLLAPGQVVVTAQVAALLPEGPDPAIGKLDFRRKPYWHLERARIENSREVPIELVVNGESAGVRSILADGRMREVRFELAVAKSSWVALRILPSSHTNPMFVLVGGDPIRASKRSAQWCLDCVDQCWRHKSFTIAPGEMQDAIDAYEHARESYRRILRECTDL